ncbi:MAG: sugar transferase [Candidatus Krumholzibacteriota bacterium]|nr:sugar transferase [Candidatus Krumholzibacteriota bacterium]
MKTRNLADPVGERTLLEARGRSALERVLKRSIDVAVSLAVLVLGFPFFLAIGLLIKLTSRGPVFFKQRRVGENGRPFFLYKFRSMKIGCDDSIHREFTQNYIQGQEPQTSLDGEAVALYKIVDDPRITAIGGFLRRTSLDELPQFINILRNEMSVVGPRPPMEYEYEHYDDWHKLRVKIKPGLTGLWQVSGRSTVPFQEMVMLDLYYIEHWSLKMDLNIMIKTVPVMLAGTGGY